MSALACNAERDCRTRTTSENCTASESWTRTKYQYDATTNGAWGNLTQIAATTNSNYTGCSQESGFTATVDGNNHISVFGYDASGNATAEGSLTYGWNAESQLKSAAGVNYLYDGDGRRVSKSNGKLYWYGAGSEILAETDASGNTLNEYIFFGGKRVALLPAGSTAQFYVEDSLGTSRVVTNNTGAVCYDADFYPFGGERPYTNSCAQNNYKFEGKERDTETGNDDFGARYYSNRFGRWLSADWSGVPVAVPYANLSNPQTLNLYSMVADDPESFADLDGHRPPNPDDSGLPQTALEEHAEQTEAEYYAQVAADNAAANSAAAQNTTQTQAQPNQQQNAAPANSRTDVLLYGREYTPTPGREYAASWTMDWYAGSCSGDKCSQSAANKQQTISLVESLNGSAFKPTGDPSKGVAHDQISPEAKTFNQHWFVDNKQVQLVVGKDSKGNLIKTWEVHVVINKLGDRPTYSPVP